MEDGWRTCRDPTSVTALRNDEAKIRASRRPVVFAVEASRLSDLRPVSKGEAEMVGVPSRLIGDR